MYVCVCVCVYVFLQRRKGKSLQVLKDRKNDDLPVRMLCGHWMHLRCLNEVRGVVFMFGFGTICSRAFQFVILTNIRVRVICGHGPSNFATQFGTPFDTDLDADPVPNSDTCHFFYTSYIYILFRLQALTKPPFNKSCKVRTIYRIASLYLQQPVFAHGWCVKWVHTITFSNPWKKNETFSHTNICMCMFNCIYSHVHDTP